MDITNNHELDFTLIGGVIRKTGAVTNVEGSLVITEQSITFVVPVTGDKMRRGGVGPTALSFLWGAVCFFPPLGILSRIGPKSRADRDIDLFESRKAAGCAFVLLSALLLFGVIFAVVKGYTRSIPMVLIFGLPPLLWLFIKLVPPRKSRWEKRLEARRRDAPPVVELDRHTGTILGDLLESSSSDIEKRLKMLAKYRAGSVNLERKDIRSVDYSGGRALVIHAIEGDYRFKISGKSDRSTLEESLREHRY